MNFPLRDGHLVKGKHGLEIVIGEIVGEHSEPIAYTLEGGWYRRSDGERMTRCNGEVMTEAEFYRRRAEGKL